MKETTRKRYSAEFKAQAVDLVKLGKPVPEVALELGIGTGILYRWTSSVRSTSQPAQLGSVGLGAVGEQAEADELRRLRRENTHHKMENDILKKAAVILGTEPQTLSRHGK
jgi:transposase